MVWACRKGDGGCAEVREVRVGGQWPVGRPRKKWSDCIGDRERYGTRSGM